MSIATRDIPTMLNEIQSMREELARRELLSFVTLNDDNYKIGMHHRVIAGQLERTLADVVAIEEGKMRREDSENLRVIIHAPPQHGKSRLISQEFPVWALGKYPWLRWISTSYAADLALEHGRIARNNMRENEALFGVSLSESAASVSRWTLTGYDRGGYLAAGVGGPITGKGAHVAIIDDPIKNYEEAASTTNRESLYNWYRTTLRTRLAKGGAVILLMTRWHQDDLAGRLLRDAKQDPRADQWKYIRLAANAEEGDILGRPIGAALWPENYDEAYLESTAVSMGSYLYNAMYQGRPSPPDGAMFKRRDFRYWELDSGTYLLHRDNGDERFSPEQCWHFQTTDPTSSDKATADWFVCSTWIVTPKNDLLLYNVTRHQMEGAEQPTLITNLYRRFMPSLVGIETNGVGATVFQILRNSGIPVYEFRASRDKVTRAIPMGAKYETHKVFHLMGQDWLDAYEEELTLFPNGEHDDQVDTASFAATVHTSLEIQNNGEAVMELDMPMVISPI